MTAPAIVQARMVLAPTRQGADGHWRPDRARPPGEPPSSSRNRYRRRGDQRHRPGQRHRTGLRRSRRCIVRGSESDVLGRFTTAMDRFPTDDVVRITADCPFIDPTIVDETVRLHRREGADYTSNTLVRTYPDGLDVEVLRSTVLDLAAREAQQSDEREHVTPFVYRQPHRFAIRQLISGRPRLGRERWTSTPSMISPASARSRCSYPTRSRPPGRTSSLLPGRRRPSLTSTSFQTSTP